MPRVFLSYSRGDLETAVEFFSSLSYSPNIDVWFDMESLYVGDRYKAVIDREIAAADYFVALLSPSYSASRFQHYELEAAMAEQRKRQASDANSTFLLPVYLSEVTIGIAGFDALHRIDCTRDRREVIGSLRSRIKHSFQARAVAENRVRCQSHIANFRGLPRDAYFLKVANVSIDPFSITHVWIEVRDQEWFFEYPAARPVPSPVLAPGLEWETFLFCDLLPDFRTKSYFEAFRVRLSNGDVYKSYKNNNVAAYGKIAGGPLNPDEMPKVLKLGL